MLIRLRISGFDRDEQAFFSKPLLFPEDKAERVRMPNLKPD